MGGGDGTGKPQNILENNAEQVSGSERPFYGECTRQKLDLTTEN